MKTAAKATLGVLTLAFAPSTYGIYHVWDVNNPKGSTWLKENGYSFSPPKFTNSDNLRHGCSKNLFSSSKEQTDPKGDNRIYGCAIMNMELQSATTPFKDNKTNKYKDPKYIKFNSEIAIRKGDEGWIIASRVGDGTWQKYFDYSLTTYLYTGKLWQKQRKDKWWGDPGIYLLGTKSYQLKSKEKVAHSLKVHEEKLVIKTPKESWWESEDWIQPTYNANQKDKFPIETKSWSGAWIDDPNASESWIFENIELYIKDKQHSQVFCKETDDQKCFVMTPYGKTKKIKDLGSFEIKEWSTVSYGTGETNSETVESMLNSTVKPIINKIKDSRGIWMDIKDVCGTKENRNLSDEQKVRLSMYCTNKKTN